MANVILLPQPSRFIKEEKSRKKSFETANFDTKILDFVK